MADTPENNVGRHIELGLDAAYAADEAFDTRREAQHDIEALDRLTKKLLIPGDMSADIAPSLEAERDAADQDFKAFVAIGEKHIGVGTIGGNAMAGIQKESSETWHVEGSIEHFLNPENKLDLEDQLAVMREFWEKLGEDVPEPSAEQKEALKATLEANPNARIVASPILPPTHRPALLEKAKDTFPKNTFSDHSDQNRPLWMPKSSAYGSLLNSPDSIYDDGHGNIYALGYKAPDGSIVSWENYKKALEEAGLTAKGADTTQWAFTPMDVGVKSERTYETAEDIHKKVGVSETPESLLTVQMLHQAVGTPNDEEHVDFANEAVYKVKIKGRGEDRKTEFPASPFDVAGLFWDPGDRQFSLVYWHNDDDGGDRFGRRGVGSEV